MARNLNYIRPRKSHIPRFAKKNAYSLYYNALRIFCKQAEKFPQNVENKKESDAEKTLPQKGKTMSDIF